MGSIVAIDGMELGIQYWNHSDYLATSEPNWSPCLVENGLSKVDSVTVLWHFGPKAPSIWLPYMEKC